MMRHRPKRSRTTFGPDEVPIEHFPAAMCPTFGPEWDYTPFPPYRLQTWHETSGPRHAQWEHWVHLKPALDRFVEQCVPAMEGRWAFIMDETSRVVFGYDSTTGTRQRFNATCWHGCEVAYQFLEGHEDLDPLELTIWEANAMAAASEQQERPWPQE